MTVSRKRLLGAHHDYVCILAGGIGGTLYIGVTNDLTRRVGEHKLKLVEGFPEKYDVVQLICFEQFDDPENAIRREKRLKKWLSLQDFADRERQARFGTIFTRRLRQAADSSGQAGQ